MPEVLAVALPLSKLARELYFTDVFDVLMVTIIMYAGLMLFKRTRSNSVFAGIAIVVGIYAVSQVFNLYLTSLILRAFFGVFIVVLVVIFQDELRRFFEFLALLGTRREQRDEAMAVSPLINSLLQAATNLAYRKIGALVILSGIENIDRHVEGGRVVDGIVSQELLESIFDPTSPGHDGAVIIRHNRIAMLGTHLPLSNDFEQIGKYGTRHAAGLGIAERSDALALIVSEERGQISIAQNGKFETFDDISKVEDRLRDFFRVKFPREASPVWRNIVRRNTSEKIGALAISSVLWFFLVYQTGTVRRDFVVPITYRNLNETLVVETSNPKEITITLESRGRAFDQLDPASLEILVDASGFTPGKKKLVIGDNMVKRPLTFSVISLSPPNIQLTIGKSPEILETDLAPQGR
ncbi:MAG: diadenylate cyclase [Patescibacteria group bacterium]